MDETSSDGINAETLPEVGDTSFQESQVMHLLPR